MRKEEPVKRWCGVCQWSLVSHDTTARRSLTVWTIRLDLDVNSSNWVREEGPDGSNSKKASPSRGYLDTRG